MSGSCPIKYTSLCGTGLDDPVCGLLEFDGCQLLLDCGCTDAFSEEHLSAITSVLPRVNAVVLSHGDLRHMGALPVLLARGLLPPSLPLVATQPVKRMGLLMLTELLADKQAMGDFTAYSAVHVAQLSDPQRWALARFYQRLQLTGGEGTGVTVVPYAAGHTLGGAVWSFMSSHGHEAVYAMDWCHRKERHLSGCLLPEWFNRPAALIMDARAALQPELDSARRDAEFLDLLVSTIRGCDGSVLVVVPTTTRLLELLLMLDEFWAREKFGRIYPLVVVSAVAAAVVEAAQSQLEWMSDTVTRWFETRRENPFSLRCVRALASISQLTQLQPPAKVVLAGASSLEHGPARQLFIEEWAAKENNTICFVTRPQADTLAWTVLMHEVGDSPQTLTLCHTKRVPLEGAELEAWLRSQDTGDGPEQPQEDAAGDAAAVAAAAAAATAAAAGSGRSSGGLQEPGAVHGHASFVSQVAAGLALPLRSSSIRLSSLVRDASGHLVQQLQQQSPAPAAPPGQAGPSTALTTATTGARPLPTALPAHNAGTAAVLMDGFEPPQGALHPMFPDEDEGVLAEQWDEYGVVVDQQAFKDAAAAMSTISLRPLGYTRVKSQPGIKMELDEDEDEDGDAGMARPGRVKAEGRVESEGEEEGEEEERPTKLVEDKTEVVVRAAVRYFNYEGLADAKMVRAAVAHIAPQSLLLLHGTDAARQDLAAHASRDLQGFGTRVHVPGAGQCVDLSALDMQPLQLSTQLQRACPTHQLGRSEQLGTVLEAVVAAPNPHFPELLQLVPPVREGAAGSGLAPAGPSLSLSSAASLGAAGEGAHLLALQLPGHHHHAEELGGAGLQGPPQGWLGDVFFAHGAEGVQLSALQAALAKAGIQSTFLGPGALSCGPVVISKAALYSSAGSSSGGGPDGADLLHAGRGHLVVEGAVSEQHDDLLQKVRHVIYTQFGAA